MACPGVAQLLSGCCTAHLCLPPLSSDEVGCRAQPRTEPQAIFPGVAQLVGRLVWELSDPIFPVKEPIRKTVAALALFSLDFSKTAV